jgi:hypothetical protein
MTVPIKWSMLVVATPYIWGQLMARVVLASIPVGVLYFLGQHFVAQGLAAGAVKEWRGLWPPHHGIPARVLVRRPYSAACICRFGGACLPAPHVAAIPIPSPR